MTYARLRICSTVFILSIIFCMLLKSGNEPKEQENSSNISRLIPTAPDCPGQSFTKEEDKQKNFEERKAFISWLRLLKDNVNLKGIFPDKYSNNLLKSNCKKRGVTSSEQHRKDIHDTIGSVDTSNAEKLKENERVTRETKADESVRSDASESHEQVLDGYQAPVQNPFLGLSHSSDNLPVSGLLTEIDKAEVNSQFSHHENMSPQCTDVNGDHLDLVLAVVDVIRTIPLTHLHLVFQSEINDCLLEKLWLQNVAMEVLLEGEWWTRVIRLTYRSYSQHMLVGSAEWIASVMDKIKLFYSNSSINAMHTKWIWVAYSSNSPTTTREPSSGKTSNIMEMVSESLQEGMRGILLFSDQSPDSAPSSKVDRPIKVAVVESSGDGSWDLGVAGIWGSGVLEKSTALWPEPPFNFHNRTVRISCINKPMVFEYQEGRGLEAATGFLSDVMRIAQTRLNFSDVILPTVGFGIPEPNGSWNGMVGTLHRKEADLSPLDFSPSYARSKVVEFSIPVSEDVLLIVSKAPHVVIKPFLILQIFSPFAWASIVGGAFFIELVVSSMSRAESRLISFLKQQSTRTQTLGNILKAFVGQTCEVWPSGNGARIAVASGFMVALILGSLYKGFITAFLAIPFRSTPIDSAEDLLSSNTRPALRARTQFVETLVFAEYGILHPARDKVGLFSETHISSQVFFEKVADGTFALADSYSSAIGRAKKFEERGKRCRFYTGKVPLRIDMDVFAFSQNSPFLYAFDDTIKWLKFFGIIDYFRRKYYALPCKAEVSSNDPQPMTLIQMQGSLYVLGIGLALGTLSFVIESLWPKVMKQKLPGFE